MNIGLVAHDARKNSLLEFVEYNGILLYDHELYATGSTGKLISNIPIIFSSDEDGDITGKLCVTCLKSGPLGGDQQMGAMIAEGKIDLLIFFVDCLSMQAHDSNIHALSRLAQLYNIPFASNRATADYIISSPLFNSQYIPKEPDFSNYLNRKL